MPANDASTTELLEPPRSVREEFAQLEIEAGIEVAVDPPPPVGDLKAEIAAFTGLDRCVKAHALRDPLLGDALSALDYDTLVRDACRVLWALSAKSVEPCRPIVASPLRQRCESYVAIVAENPKMCPTRDGTPSSERDPVCLARAARDERLCAAASSSERTTCRALVLGRREECGNNATCLHQVERWTALFTKPEAHTPFSTRLGVDISLDAASSLASAVSVGDEAGSGGGAGRATHVDLGELAAAGASLQISADRARLALGSPKSALWSSWDSPLASPRLYFELTVPPRMLDKIRDSASPDAGVKLALGPFDSKLDLIVPRVADLSALTGSNLTLTIARLAAEPRGPVSLVLTGKLRSTPRVFDVRIEVETFVRDVVGER